MPMMTTREFDQILAAFSFLLERAIAETPAYFETERLEQLRDDVEEIRLAALEKEANAQLAGPDLGGEVLHWINLIGRHLPSDE